MRAFTLDAFDSPPGLRDDVPEPEPAGHELLVRVHGSSINPVDAAIAAGVLKEMAEHEFPITLGRDFAGVVERTGGDVSHYQPGDEVYGFFPAGDPSIHAGTWAELITAPEDNLVAPKPRTLDMESAGAAPLAAITALAGFDALTPATGETVLVVGATGGVGSFFVQLAAGAGAHVIAPAFPDDEEYLRELGVVEIIDRNTDLERYVSDRHADGVDAMLDLVSYAARDSVLKEGGRLASPLGAAGDGQRRFNLMAQPTPRNLERLTDLLESGALRVHIQRSYEVAQAAEALADLSGSHTRGKLGLAIA